MADVGLPEIVAEVAKETGATQKVVKEVLAVALREIEYALAYDDASVTLQGFGKFWISETPAHTARDPRTGDPVHVPARRRVRFSPSKTLTERIKNVPMSEPVVSKPTIVYRKRRVSKS